MNPRLVKVIPNVEDNVPREFGNFKKHDDGNASEKAKSTSKCRNEVTFLKWKFLLTSKVARLFQYPNFGCTAFWFSHKY
jgi:hypothetical protein